MKKSTPRSLRRRSSLRDPGGPQADRKPEGKFFGPESRAPFFPPAVQRAAEAKPAAAPGEDKKEEAIAKAPEEKREEKLAKAPEEKKREDKLTRAAETGEKKEPADKVQAKSASGREAAGAATIRYVENIGGKGDPLPAREREFFGGRMAFDFGAVRIHTGGDAAESARDAGAKAYTYGNHVVFNEGRYQPGTHEGRRLLAHELAHVMQQTGAGPGKADGTGSGRDATQKAAQEAGQKPGQKAVHADRDRSDREKPGGRALHRQTGDGTRGGPATAAPMPAAPVPAAPSAAATDPDAFRARLFAALRQMTTPTVAGETASAALEPVLREMAANAEWVDASGAAGGGAEIPFRLAPGGARVVRLRLVVDDNPNPPLDGRFDATGADLGVVRVYARRATDADTLATTLYHESLHLVRWLSRNSPGGDLVAETGARGGSRAVIENIDPARHPRHLAEVRRRVAELAASVNASRPASDRIGDSGIDRVAGSMLEEYLVRIESEVFRLMRDSDAVSHRRLTRPPTARPEAEFRLGTGPDTFFRRGDVDLYLFEVNGVFRPQDRAALDDHDRGLIDNLTDYFRDRVLYFVRLRYSEAIHGPDFP